LSSDRRIASLTPCAGRCSTVFGDAVWQRLDAQLDQILVPMLPMANLAKVETFVLSKRVRLREDATKGRKLYHALKLCEKNRHFTDESGLGIHYKQVRPLWDEFEHRVLALAKASYDLAFLRADGMSQHLIQMQEEDE